MDLRSMSSHSYVSQIKQLTEELAQAKQRIRHLEAKYLLGYYRRQSG